MTATCEVFDHRPKRPKRLVRLLIKILRWRREVKVRRYVGTDEISGQLQLKLLKRKGCTPVFRVLQIGCGGLHVGMPLKQYMDKGNYVGINPNEWLRQTVTKKKEHVSRIVAEREPRFMSCDEFDASELGIKFDLGLTINKFEPYEEKNGLGVVKVPLKANLGP